MQLETIKLYCDVAQHRSVSRAAELHGITQSAASQRLIAMEKELGVQLLDRSKRPLQLTPSGEIYQKGCREIIHKYEKLQQQITGSDINSKLHGEINIAAIYSSGLDLLNQVKEEFEALYPRCKVRIDYHQPLTVYDRVTHDLCDIGIISYPHRWRELASVHVRDEMMALICRPDHKLASQDSVKPSDLARLPMVVFDSHLPIRRQINSYFKKAGISINVAQSFDNIDTMKTYIQQTGRVGILPAQAVLREIQRGELCAVRLEPGLSRPLAIVYHRGQELSAPVQAFVNYLIKHQPETVDPTLSPVIV